LMLTNLSASAKIVTAAFDIFQVTVTDTKMKFRRDGNWNVTPFRFPEFSSVQFHGFDSKPTNTSISGKSMCRLMSQKHRTQAIMPWNLSETRMIFE
jgi:hypothetical protein